MHFSTERSAKHMLIRAYSDFHGFLPQIDPCDALLIAGDVCPVSGEYGDHTPKTQARWLRDVFRPWCIDMPVDYIILTPGNHDAIFEPKNKGFHFELSRKVAFVIDRTVEIDRGGPRVYAEPWIPNLAMWPFYQSNLKLEARAESLPGNADIWMFHAPPASPENRAYALDLTKHGDHVGNKYITPKIVEKAPQLVICGHIHEGFGVDRIGQSDVANVAFVDENYEPRWSHLEITWSETNREVTRIELAQDDPRRGLWSGATI